MTYSLTESSYQAWPFN